MKAQKPLKILVADDSPVEREILDKLLSKKGHHVDMAVNGNEVIELFQHNKYDLIILDVIMPKLSGLDAAKKIKTKCKEQFIPIMFITGLSEVEDLAICLESGGDDVLTKPVDKTLLYAKIEVLMRMRNLYDNVKKQNDSLLYYNEMVNTEQQVAKKVFDSIAHVGYLESNMVKYILSPMSTFNGDVLLAAKKPTGDLHILLGDFTGHGLPAAIGALPMADVFYTMTKKGFGATDILPEINHKLKQILPTGIFCAAALIEVDINQNCYKIWCGGLPEIIIYNQNNGIRKIIHSQHVPLGILDDDAFEISMIVEEIEKEDQLYVYSDGIIEAENAQGEMFGEKRLRDIFYKCKKGDGVFNSILQELSHFAGEESQGDDITMIEVCPDKIPTIDDDLAIIRQNDFEEHHNCDLSYELREFSLRKFNPIPHIMSLVTKTQITEKRASQLHNILNELYNNSLEHGILNLGKYKSEQIDFSEFYELRETALSRIDSGYIKINVSSEIEDDTSYLNIRFEDSGKGFDYSKLLAADSISNSDLKRSGIPLIVHLADQVSFNELGNAITVKFKWV